MYAVVVRSSEYDLPQEMLDDMVALSVTSYNADPRDRRAKSGYGIKADDGGGYDSD